MNQPAPNSDPLLPRSMAARALLRATWFLNADWISRENAQRQFQLQFRKDRLGHTLHLGIACFALLVACMPVGFAEPGAGILLIYYVIRLTSTYATFWRPIVMPLGLSLLALIAWEAISISWSIDRAHGWNELSKFRWFVFPLMLWPVLDRRPALIATLCIGLFLGNISQVAQTIGRHYDIYNILEVFTGGNIEWMLDKNRTGGWWHPLAAGSMLVAALGLHLPAAIMGSGKSRAIALVGAAISIVGIVATGTRGAILASMVLIVLMLVFAFFRVQRSRKSIGFAALALGIAGCIGMMTIGDRVILRADMAVGEVKRALEGNDLTSDNGARVQMAIWCFDALKERPFTGVGAGAFEGWTRKHVVDQGKDPAKSRYFEHAHNSLLHIAATTGLIGVSLALIVAFTALWGAFAPLSRQQQGTYAAGPGWALIGMFIVSMTDPVHFNTQTGILLFVLFALCPAWRPAVLRGTAPS